MNKKGQELSTNTIIIIILAVLVLIIVAIFFTGGFGNFTTKVKNLWGQTGQDISEVVLNCNTYCNNYERTGLVMYKDNYCNKEHSVDTTGDNKVDSTIYCTDLPEVSCSQIEAEGCF